MYVVSHNTRKVQENSGFEEQAIYAPPLWNVLEHNEKW
jgi:hypothetical protein